MLRSGEANTQTTSAIVSAAACLYSIRILVHAIAVCTLATQLLVFLIYLRPATYSHSGDTLAFILANSSRSGGQRSSNGQLLCRYCFERGAQKGGGVHGAKRMSQGMSRRMSRRPDNARQCGHYGLATQLFQTRPAANASAGRTGRHFDLRGNAYMRMRPLNSSPFRSRNELE